MAFGHGKKQAFSLDNAAGALQALTAYITDISFSRPLDTAEVSTIGDDDKEHIVGQQGGTISLSGKTDPTLDLHMDALMAALKAGTIASATFNYGPQGSTATYVKYSGECILTSYDMGGGSGSSNDWSAELLITGAVTRGAF